MPTTGFVSIDWSIIFVLINTLITFLIVKKFLYKPVKKMMQDREDEVKKVYDDAEKAKAEAEESKEQYAKKLSNAKAEANQIISDASKKAQLRGDEIIEEASSKATNMVLKAEQEIAKEKKKAVNEIKNEISDIALMIASKVVEKDITSKDHEKLIEEFIDNVGDSKWQS